MATARGRRHGGEGGERRGELGSIVRSLGCFPTEAELHELLAKVEEEEPTGYIHLEKFLPVMTKVLLDRSYWPIPEDVLLHAFEALDEKKCGHITKEELIKYLTEEGEPFTQEEMEDMLSTALDPETNTVRYRDYISMMPSKNMPPRLAVSPPPSKDTVVMQTEVQITQEQTPASHPTRARINTKPPEAASCPRAALLGACR
ncbi:dynein regulatory complex protein 8 isoform X3 [Opisthocomus hoazin]|uniref:dynein regulatory complex protein 8 isoform X3 n=1 Tax=Opisthocomus hoazin TaxID=30419 RepID=UPI003F52EC33